MILHTGRHAAALLAGGVGIRGCVGFSRRCEAVAIAGKARRLRNDFAACLARRRFLRFGLRRHFQHRAGTQPVDVATNESVGIVPIQGQQHLVERHGVLTLSSRRCHVIQTIAALHGVRTTGCSVRCGSSRSRLLGTHSLASSAGLACWCRRGCSRGCSLRLRGRSTRRRFSGARRCGLHHRRRRKILRGIAGAYRVQQERISARNVAARPVQVNQDINERLGDGLGRTQTHHVVAIRLALQRSTQRGDDRVVGQTGTRISVRRSQFGDQVLRLFGRHAGQIDFGLQRLAEAGTHVQRAETGRLRSGLNQQQARRSKRDGRPARTAMGRFSPAVLAHPHLRLRYLLMCKRT